MKCCVAFYDPSGTLARHTGSAAGRHFRGDYEEYSAHGTRRSGRWRVDSIYRAANRHWTGTDLLKGEVSDDDIRGRHRVWVPDLRGSFG